GEPRSPSAVALVTTTRFPLPSSLSRDCGTDRKGFPALEQLALEVHGHRRGLDEYLHLPFTAHSQIPGGDLTRSGSVRAALRRTGADHLKRHIPHVPLATTPAHVPGGASVFGHKELG